MVEDAGIGAELVLEEYPNEVAAQAEQRLALRFGISSVGEANQRKIENGWWELIDGGRRGLRISIDNRAPIVLTPFGDSLVSAPDSVAHTPAVTLRAGGHVTSGRFAATGERSQRRQK